MDHPCNKDDGQAAKAQFVYDGISQLQQLGVFKVQGQMSMKMIEDIFSVGWNTGEKWAKRQSQAKYNPTDENRSGYRDGYRDGLKDGQSQGYETALARRDGPRGLLAWSVESDTTFRSNYTQNFESPQPAPAPGIALAPNVAGIPQAAAQKTQSTTTSVILGIDEDDTNASATYGQAKLAGTIQAISKSSFDTASYGQQNDSSRDQLSPSPAVEEKAVKVKVRDSVSPLDIGGNDLTRNGINFNSTLDGKQAGSLMDSVERPDEAKDRLQRCTEAVESAEKPETHPKRATSTPHVKRADSLTETIEEPKKPENYPKRSREAYENTVKHETSPKKPREEARRDSPECYEGKRKKITTSSLGNLMYSSEDDLDNKDLLATTCPASLRSTPCQLGPNDRKSCSLFHLCTSYLKGRCYYPNHHGNSLHLMPTCFSVVRQRDCFNRRSCIYGHDHPDIRLHKHVSLDTLYRNDQTRGRPVASSDTRREHSTWRTPAERSPPTRPAADRSASHYSPSRFSESRRRETGGAPPTQFVADRLPSHYSPRR